MFSQMKIILNILLLLICILALGLNFFLGSQYNFPVPLKNDHVTLTFMTTFSDSKARRLIETNTVKNWALLGTNVQNLNWYVGESLIKNFSSSYGWLNAPTNHSNQNLPIIKHLYLEAVNITNTTYYGFSNSDILFSRNLITTLRAVDSFHTKNHPGRPFLMVGRRRDVSIKEIGNLTGSFHEDLINDFKSKGKLRGTATIDYFITSHPFHYPWAKFLEVVVARSGWDNYMISYAHDNKIITYDSTITTTAIHQSYSGKGSSGVRSRLPYLNYGILKAERKNMIGHILGNGQLKSTNYYSDFSLNNKTIHITERKNVKKTKTKGK